MPRIVVSSEHRWWMDDSKIAVICKYLKDIHAIKYNMSKRINGDVVIKFDASAEQMKTIRKQLQDVTLRLICKIED